MKFIYDKYQNTAEDFKKFMINSFQIKSDIYKRNLIQCQNDLSNQNIHDLRVACRRFVTVLNLYKIICYSSYFDIIIKDIKKNFDNFGRLRDYFVMINNCRNIQNDFPVIIDFINYIENKSNNLLSNISKILSKINLKEFDAKFYFLLRDLKYQSSQDSQNFTAFENFLNAHLQLMKDLFFKIDYSSPETIHKFRIATKKFRYTCEILKDFVPNYKDLYTKLVKIQDDTGIIQDNVVLFDEFRRYTEKKNVHKNKNNENIENLLNYLKNRQISLISNFKNDEEIIRSIIK